MKISKIYNSPIAIKLINQNHYAEQAFHEIERSILDNKTNGMDHFVINSSEKNCNGVVPIKEKCYQILEYQYDWFREKPLPYLRDEAKKGGPIDVYKQFGSMNSLFRVGLEFETGNISSAHRSINKLCVGIRQHDLDMAFLMMPIKKFAFYLTDRVSNYEELEPYFVLLDSYPFVVFGFDAEEYNPNVPLLPKGKDGMSHRSIRKWEEP